MADTATIDIVSYASPTADSNIGNRANVDKSCGFNNILKKANETYTKAENSSSITHNQNKEKIQNTASVDKNEPTNTAETSDKAVSDSGSQVENKKVEDRPQENTKQNPQEKNQDDTNNALGKSVSDKNESKTADEVQTVDGKSSNTSELAIKNVEDSTIIVSVNIENVQPTPQTAADVANTALENLISKTQITSEKSSTPMQDSGQIIQNVEEAVNATNSVSETLPVKEVATPANNVENPEIIPPVIGETVIQENVLNILALNTQSAEVNNTAITNNTQVIQDNLAQATPVNVNINLTNSENDLSMNQVNNLEVEPQIQINLQANKTEKAVQTEQKIQPQQPSQQIELVQGPQIKNVEVQTPVVEVSVELAASNANNLQLDASVKQENQAILDKANLTQEALNKTNARIINIENSGSAGTNSSGSNSSNTNSNNLKNNQNTQDQVVKLALEKDSVTTNALNTDASADLSNVMSDNVTQTGFAKTLGNVQTQASAQPQTSKLISDTEIMSQINNKLNNLKDEGTSKISIVLKPENLGKLNLELVNSKDGMTAQITTNNAQVKEILDKSLDGLRDNLSSQGVNVNSVTVKVAETEKQSNDMTSFENQMGQNQRQSSNNTNHAKENGFTFDKEIENGVSTDDYGSEIETIQAEKVVSIGSGNGRINYKV